MHVNTDIETFSNSAFVFTPIQPLLKGDRFAAGGSSSLAQSLDTAASRQGKPGVAQLPHSAAGRVLANCPILTLVPTSRGTVEEVLPAIFTTKVHLKAGQKLRRDGYQIETVVSIEAGANIPILSVGNMLMSIEAMPMKKGHAAEPFLIVCQTSRTQGPRASALEAWRSMRNRLGAGTVAGRVVKADPRPQTLRKVKSPSARTVDTRPKPQTGSKGAVPPKHRLGEVRLPMVNLFRLPDPNSEWIGRLSSGQQVAIVSQWKGWYAIVMTDKSQAYVSAKGIKLLPFAVLTLEEAEANETPVPEGEPDAPPMRVVGIIFGKERSATLQVGGEYLQVTVGQQFPKDKPLFTVVAIDDEKVHLTREWRLNGKTRIQRIVVSLSASPPPSINAK